MKNLVTTMSLARKRQAVFPLHWCRREGLEHDGPVDLFDLGKYDLLIRFVKPPGKTVIE